MPSPLVDYKPTFFQPIKGSFQENSNIYMERIGTDAYVTENELNEGNWLHVENTARILREMTKSGVLTVSNDKERKCFDIVNNDKKHLNSFEMPPFNTVVNGFLTHHEYYRTNEPLQFNIPVRLPNPPVGGYRHDFVYLEFWFVELKKDDKVPKFGYDTNSSLNYHILDDRIDAETSRKIQLQWTVSHYEDYDDLCENGFLKPDGKPNEKIHPLAQTGYHATNYYFEPVDYDDGLFRAGSGLVVNQKIHTIDGYVYAIPLFNILRYNNSGFHAQNNPMGGIDYVDEDVTPTPDRPDEKYSNIIYTDQIKDLRHLAAISEEQYNKVFVRFEQYGEETLSLRRKVDRLTNDLNAVTNAVRNLGFDIPSLHDKEIYGVNMSHLGGLTDGGMIDPLDDTARIAYHKHNKFYLTKNMIGKEYTLIPTLVDYDYEDKGALGDLYVNKYTNKYRIYNTGASGLRMNFEAIEVDNEIVFSGEARFHGMDGTTITMPFNLNEDRYFIHVVAESNENGRNGEIFVKIVENEFIVYNTGLKTSESGVITSTSGNVFQWTVIDLYNTKWKNINYMNVMLDGQNGVNVSSKEFGEHYRLSLGTPIITSAMTVEQGSIGDIYADIDEEDIFTVYNTGGQGATVQCLVFNDKLYEEYYDSLEYKENSEVPTIKFI